MSKYWSNLVSRLDPYVPGEQPKVSNLIKLNTNENPYPPSPKVHDAVRDDLIDQLRLYPDPSSQRLKQAFASFNGISEDQVFVGNGSDEVLAHSFAAFFKKELPLLYPEISYSFYPVYAKLYEIQTITPALTDALEINLDSFVQPNGGIIFPNPNAPTGIAVDLKDIEKLLIQNTESVVIVDEAYIDFGGVSAISLIGQYSNLLVVQTLSKSRSLAGIRIGFAVGQKHLIDGLTRVKDSFNSYPIDRIAEEVAIASIEDSDYFNDCNKKVIATRIRVSVELELLGFDVLPSSANFVFARPTKIPAKTVFEELRAHNILVRFFNKPKLEDHLRISIGTDDEMDALITALKVILG